MTSLTEKLVSGIRSAGVELPDIEWKIRRLMPSRNQKSAGAHLWTLYPRYRHDLKYASFEMRIGSVYTVTEGPAPIEMLARVPSEECGCPEELWRIDGIELLFHFEEDGHSDAFIFAGDWEAETKFKADTLDDLRAKAFQWFADTTKPEDTDCRDFI